MSIIFHRYWIRFRIYKLYLSFPRSLQKFIPYVCHATLCSVEHCNLAAFSLVRFTSIVRVPSFRLLFTLFYYYCSWVENAEGWKIVRMRIRMLLSYVYCVHCSQYTSIYNNNYIVYSRQTDHFRCLLATRIAIAEYNSILDNNCYLLQVDSTDLLSSMYALLNLRTVYHTEYKLYGYQLVIRRQLYRLDTPDLVYFIRVRGRVFLSNVRSEMVGQCNRNNNHDR